jgi:hypothetical protein
VRMNANTTANIEGKRYILHLRFYLRLSWRRCN